MPALLEHARQALHAVPPPCVTARTDEHDGGRLLVGHAEQLAHELGPVSQVLLDQLGAHLCGGDGGRDGGNMAHRNVLNRTGS